MVDTRTRPVSRLDEKAQPAAAGKSHARRLRCLTERHRETRRSSRSAGFSLRADALQFWHGRARNRLLLRLVHGPRGAAGAGASALRPKTRPCRPCCAQTGETCDVGAASRRQGVRGPHDAHAQRDRSPVVLQPIDLSRCWRSSRTAPLRSPSALIYRQRRMARRPIPNTPPRCNPLHGRWGYRSTMRLDCRAEA